MQRSGCLLLALAVLMAGAVRVNASSPSPRATAIQVKGLHCNHCARRIATKLQAVPNVAAVHADLKTNTMIVSPREATDVSPRAIWEAAEAARFEPVRLVGPLGTFTTKPEL